MKIKPSNEACQKAYQFILPTVIEIYKKKKAKENQTA